MTDAPLLPQLRVLAALLLLALATPALAELSITQGSAVASSAAPSATAPEWVYTLRPGESFSEVAGDLLSSRYGPGRLLQYNDIDNAATLGEGDRIRIPLAWLKRQPDPARVASVSGAVQLISGVDGQKRPLIPDALIRVGDEIISGAGTATIELADGSEVRLSPESRLTFNRLTQYGRSGMIDTRLRLNRGEVHTRVKPVIEGGSRFEIETPSAVAAVRGTAFALQTSASGTSLQVTRGVLDFGDPGKVGRSRAG